MVVNVHPLPPPPPPQLPAPQVPQPLPQLPPVPQVVPPQGVEMPYEIRQVDVEAVRYSQKDIKAKFRNGQPLYSLVVLLQQGQVSATAPFLLLDAFEDRLEDGTVGLFSTDNRRLWCLKRYQQLLKQKVFIRVKVLKHHIRRLMRDPVAQQLAKKSWDHFDTQDKGMTVRFRQSPSANLQPQWLGAVFNRGWRRG